MSEETKRCDFCGEEILAIAKKCKHCGSDLEKKPATDYGMFLLGIPVFATLLLWYGVSDMNLPQSQAEMGLIAIATTLGTAIVAAMESSKAEKAFAGKRGSYSPRGWFVLITFLWIVAYPLYLFSRKHYGLANRLAFGIIVALIYIGTLVMMT